jgi:hypothetical protein
LDEPQDPDGGEVPGASMLVTLAVAGEFAADRDECPRPRICERSCEREPWEAPVAGLTLNRSRSGRAFVLRPSADDTRSTRSRVLLRH